MLLSFANKLDFVVLFASRHKLYFILVQDLGGSEVERRPRPTEDVDLAQAVSLSLKVCFLLRCSGLMSSRWLT